MARQLIICCDGTNNNLTGGRNDTNVTQLCELLAPDGQEQLLYYDPGVGNPGELPGATWTDSLSRRAERLYGLVFGKGIYENIGEAYRFLMRNWRPGDQIFLFGFSRGAFTARSVGGLVTQFGILRPDMDVMVPTLMHIYFSDRDKGANEYELIRTQIRDLFAAEPARLAPVWFVGVWDTVASVGAPLLSREITASPTIVGKRFQHVRQALALDEYRRSFRQRPYVIETGYDYAAHGQSIEQLWFSGAHCDIGGGYLNAEAGLSRQALLWMVQEAADCELRLRPGLLDAQGQLDPVAVVRQLEQRSATAGPRQRLVHSELHDGPLWALGGMEVRDPHKVRRWRSGKDQAPVESPSVAANALIFPADTVWARRRGWAGLLLAAALAFIGWMLAGAFLLGPTVIEGRSWLQQLWSCFFHLPQIAGANLAFAHWQIGWFMPLQAPTTGLPPFAHPGLAILADFALIAGYAYVLAHVVTWAFARIARLRRVGMTPSAWLNLLGMAACVAVLADIAEDLLTWALLLLAPNAYVPGLEGLLGLSMSAACALKWLGLAGSLLLVLIAATTRRR